MDTAQTLVTVFSSTAVMGVLTIIVQALIKYANGSAGREKARNTDIRTQLANAVLEAEKARDDRDDADTRRRKTAEYASALRRQLIENGHTPAAWPEDLGETTPQKE